MAIILFTRSELISFKFLNKLKSCETCKNEFFTLGYSNLTTSCPTSIHDLVLQENILASLANKAFTQLRKECFYQRGEPTRKFHQFFIKKFTCTSGCQSPTKHFLLTRKNELNRALKLETSKHNLILSRMALQEEILAEYSHELKLLKSKFLMKKRSLSLKRQTCFG